MLFGGSCFHEPVFLFEIRLNLQRNHVLPVVASYSVVKEPTSVERAARLPDPPVRVKRNVFSFLNSFRLTRTPVTMSKLRLKRSNCSGCCRAVEPTSRLPRCQPSVPGTVSTALSRRLFQPCGACRSLPTSACLRSVAQRSLPVQGPLTTCRPAVLFPLRSTIRCCTSRCAR
jgi:hypothetical protein